jgi:hypothetical protein
MTAEATHELSKIFPECGHQEQSKWVSLSLSLEVAEWDIW